MIIIDVAAFYVGLRVLAAVVELFQEEECFPSASEERTITVSAAGYHAEATHQPQLIHQPQLVGDTCTEYTEYGAELTSL